MAVEPPVVGCDGEFRDALAVLDAGDHLLVLGEVGIGKSRLVREVSRCLAAEHLVLTGRCMPLGRGLPLPPVVEVMRSLLRGTTVRSGAG